MKKLVLPLVLLGLLTSCGGQTAKPQQLLNLYGSDPVNLVTGKFTTTTPWNLTWSVSGNAYALGHSDSTLIDTGTVMVDRLADEDAYKNGVKQPLRPFDDVLMPTDRKSGHTHVTLIGTFQMYVHSPGVWAVKVVTDP